MFEDMGWTINKSCNVAAISGLTAANDGPTILGSATRLTAAISGGSDVSYQWDFGDGNSGSGAVVSHHYAEPGLYTAEVTASNSSSFETAVTAVTVDTLITDLTAENSSPILPGLATQLTAAVSGGSSVTYEWDFGDSSSGAGAEVSHQYAAPGAYTAEVTATNSVSQETAVTAVTVIEATDKIYYPVMIKP